MYIFREEDSKLSISQLKKHIRRIVEKQNVFLIIIFTIRGNAFLSWLPADGFPSVYTKLYVNILIVTFKFLQAYFFGFARGIAKDSF